MILTEGLKKGDLDSMVLPLLTIDEYDSKISNDQAIVVGFYVFEQDAASDLSNFIERSPYLIMDTDVSPAPTKDGYYLTFIEMQRSPEFVDALLGLLDEVNLLTNVDNWQFTSPKLSEDEIKDATEQNLKKYVDCQVRDPQEQKIKECFEFFSDSTLSDVILHENNRLELHKFGIVYNFDVIELSDNVPQGQFDINEGVSSRCIKLQTFLCGPYSVHSINGQTVIEHTQNQLYLTLKTLRY